MSDFSEQCDRLHMSGKINGLLQAQVIALQYAAAQGAMSEYVARQIAEQIGQAVAAMQGNIPAEDQPGKDAKDVG